jgi:hypothetical protein
MDLSYEPTTASEIMDRARMLARKFKPATKPLPFKPEDDGSWADGIVEAIGRAMKALQQEGKRGRRPIPFQVVNGRTWVGSGQLVAAGIAAKHDTTVDELLVSNCRKVRLVRARQELMWALQTELNWSQQRIGDLMRLDRSTVAHHLRKYGQALQMAELKRRLAEVGA